MFMVIFAFEKYFEGKSETAFYVIYEFIHDLPFFIKYIDFHGIEYIINILAGLQFFLYLYHKNFHGGSRMYSN